MRTGLTPDVVNSILSALTAASKVFSSSVGTTTDFITSSNYGRRLSVILLCTFMLLSLVPAFYAAASDTGVAADL